MKNGLFPNMEGNEIPAFKTVDAPLWFIWAVQQYTKSVKSYATIWRQLWKGYDDRSWKHTGKEHPLALQCMRMDLFSPDNPERH